MEKPGAVSNEGDKFEREEMSCAGQVFDEREAPGCLLPASKVRYLNIEIEETSLGTSLRYLTQVPHSGTSLRFHYLTSASFKRR